MSFHGYPVHNQEIPISTCFPLFNCSPKLVIHLPLFFFFFFFFKFEGAVKNWCASKQYLSSVEVKEALSLPDRILLNTGVSIFISINLAQNCQ